MRKRRCCACGVLTYDWEKINGGPPNCWDCGRIARQPEIDRINARANK